VQAVRPQSAAQSAADEDDVPAIQRQQADGAAANASPSVSSPRPTPMSIQDYLKNQQRK
jgi:cell division protein FtsZ